MSTEIEIKSPHAPALKRLTAELSDLANFCDQDDQWPARQLALCAKHGVFKWFVPKHYGGNGWDDQEIVKGYIKLAAACLTTTFVITQRTGACKRILESENVSLAKRLLPGLVSGAAFTTLGISHLTTSSRHLSKPILVAKETDKGWLLNGMSPWVTGAHAADHIVIGSEVESGEQILLAVAGDLPGLTVGQPNDLVALSGSKTGQVSFDQVMIPHEFVLAGPKENVLKQGKRQSTGGLQTSALAIGLASAAVDFVKREASKPNRSDLVSTAAALESQYNGLLDRILALAGGDPVCTNEELRTDANSFALRAAQAALVTAKGTGFVAGHSVGRWCREALFFLVWSCPQVVRDANLCELAGILD